MNSTIIRAFLARHRFVFGFFTAIATIVLLYFLGECFRVLLTIDPPAQFGVSLGRGRSLHFYETESDVLYLTDGNDRKVIRLDGPVVDNNIRSSANYRYVVFKIGHKVMRGEFTSDKNWVDNFKLIPFIQKGNVDTIFADIVPITLDKILSISDDGRRILAVLRYGQRTDGCPEGYICGGQGISSSVVVIDGIAKKGRIFTADMLEP